jgi:hypothetical protein
MPPGAVLAIEYAIWWDWDIQHLYELEHIWIFVAVDGTITHAEASWHGDYHRMLVDGELPIEDGRLTVYAEPGKHALAPAAEWLLNRTGDTNRDCKALPGLMGLHVTPLFQSRLRHRRNPVINWLVRAYLRQYAFQPSYDFSLIVDLRDVTSVPWDRLSGWIPDRVVWWTHRLYGLVVLQDEGLRQLLTQGLQSLERFNRDLVHVMEPSSALTPVRASGRVSDVGWHMAGKLLSGYFGARRFVWLIGQRFMDGLHSIGVHQGTLFAAFRDDVRAEVQSWRLLDGFTILPPALEPVRYDSRRIDDLPR